MTQNIFTKYGLALGLATFLAGCQTAPDQPAPAAPPVQRSTTTVATVNTYQLPAVEPMETRVITITRTGSEKWDVTSFDQRLKRLIGLAEHYPVEFPNPRLRPLYEADAVSLSQEIQPRASNNGAHFDVLIRAVKINQVCRNLDTCVDSAMRANTYATRALKMNPKNGEINYWYGVMLSEGGGMNEGMPYLKKAVAAGIKEANLAIAQAYLLLNNRKKALEYLYTYKQSNPSDTRVENYIKAVNSGKYYIW